MADVADQRDEGGGGLSTQLPSKYLPAVEYRDLPEPRSLGKYLGASVIILATALGSGELIIWPYITSQVGMGLLWLAIVGFSMQFFLNMEIERYTLATGETAVMEFWSESKIYLAVVWFLTIAGSLILLSGLSQPIVFLSSPRRAAGSSWPSTR